MTFSKNPYWIKSGTYSFLQNITRLLFGFGSFYLLVRSLTVEEFGIWSLFLIVANFIEVARNGLIQNGLIVALQQGNPNEKAEIQSASFLINIFFTIFSIILLLLFHNYLSAVWEAPALAMVLLIFTSTVALALPLSHFLYIQQANFSFKGIFYSNLVRNGIFFFLILYHFIADQTRLSLNFLIIYQSISVLVAGMVAYGFAKKFFSGSFHVSRTRVTGMLQYGKFVFANNLISIFLRSVDQILLGYLMSPAAVANYNTSLRITNLTEIPTQSIASVVFPQSAKKSKEGNPEPIKRLYEKSVGTILAMILPLVIVVLIFPETIVTIIAGNKYQHTASILQVMIFYSFFIPYSRQFGTILDSIGMPEKNLIFTVFGAVLNTVLVYFCIIKYGILGSVVGTLISLIIRFGLQYWFLYKTLNVNILNTIRYAFHFYKFSFQTIKKKFSN